MTALNPPVVYYNKKWKVAPLIVTTQEQADSLDLTEWTTIPPPASPPAPQFPLLYYDVNVPLVVVDSEEELAALDTTRYKRLHVSQAVVTAAQANLTAGA